MRLRLALLFTFSFLAFFGFSQTKVLTATRADQQPKIDGNLEEAAWQQAPVATDFIQNFPAVGAPASAKTKVRILYDDAAVYIGAYLYDDPALIRKQLTARDGEQQSDVDYFSVFFDTYNDQQNGFQFLVTTANVQSDAKLDPSSSGMWGNYGDKSWDAVWQSKTALRPDGWVVEMRIPYISLRFSKKEIQTWGLQFSRYIRRNSETSFWNPVKPDINGFANQFGKYTDIKDIQPPLRLSLSPYLSTGVRHTPFEYTAKTTEWLRSGGMDIKYGINESFTLDATVVPDFGQVVSDNVINNLTPYEQRFQENRPFFTEGTELFNKAGLFYSRRIGALPGDYNRVEALVGNDPNWEIVNNPSITQLYNAVKFSGRNKKKLGIGVFNAIAAPMYAYIRNTAAKRDTSILTEPLANYNIVVLDQAFKGRSSVTFTNTNVTRNGSAHDANVSALDWGWYMNNNTHVISGTARYSNTLGYRPYSSAYFLNTDTVMLNGRRYLKPYDGFTSRLRFAKVSGKVQYSVSGEVQSDKYDPNDLGYLQSPNKVVYAGGISYNQFEPTKNFLNYNYSLNVFYNWLYKPYAFNSMEIAAEGFWLFKNMWDVSLSVGTFPFWQNDYFELRTPGRFVQKPWYVYSFLSGSTDSRKRLFGRYEVGVAEGALPNNPYFRTSAGLRYRFSNQFSLSMDLYRQHDKSQVGYAFIREQNGEPIIGFREYKDFTSLVSGIYNFSPRMNLTVRARHYWSRINYQSFHNVSANGKYISRHFVEGMDDNFNVFNVDAFFTWDFRLGSRIIAGWKNWLGPDVVEADQHRYYAQNFRRTFDFAHGNELTLRVIFFLDYNQLRSKN
jgi:hypothetical protein